MPMRNEQKPRTQAWIDWTGFLVASVLGAVIAVSLANALAN
jgi:hypothetical protein